MALETTKERAAAGAQPAEEEEAAEPEAALGVTRVSAGRGELEAAAALVTAAQRAAAA